MKPETRADKNFVGVLSKLAVLCEDLRKEGAIFYAMKERAEGYGNWQEATWAGTLAKKFNKPSLRVESAIRGLIREYKPQTGKKLAEIATKSQMEAIGKAIGI